MRDLPADHPVYNVAFKVDARAFPLRAVSNGPRLLMVHSPRDIAAAWQSRDEGPGRAKFELGVNLFVYAAGKRDLRNRLDPTHVADTPGEPPLGTLRVARVQYSGGWDPEPAAWQRMARLFRRRDTGAAVREFRALLKGLPETPEDAVPFRLVLDPGELQRGDYELSIDVVKENQFWLAEKGTTPRVIPVVIA